jgi:hypothetical protein
VNETHCHVIIKENMGSLILTFHFSLILFVNLKDLTPSLYIYDWFLKRIEAIKQGIDLVCLIQATRIYYLKTSARS